MKRYLLMHVGFEKPTPEIMSAWNRWFAQAAPHTLENLGLRNGVEIGPGGVRNLPMDLEAITGCTILSAASFDEAQKLAASNPFVSSIRIYQIA